MLTADLYSRSTVCNIYFDTPDSRLIRTSLEKPEYKEKLRLRSYGVPDSENSNVFLEIKKKYDGVVYKRRISLTKRQADDYLCRGINPQIKHADVQIFKEIDYMIGFYGLIPMVYLAYDRIALKGIEDLGLRITFDTNISSRTSRLDLAYGCGGKKLTDENLYLMEIKFGGGCPIELAEILSRLKIYPTSFSKYGEVYKKQISQTFQKHICMTKTNSKKTNPEIGTEYVAAYTSV